MTATETDERAQLVLRGVWKTFDRLGGADPLVALEDISLSIERGRFVALIGRSGCGKSTLLRAIAGLTTPSRGEVLHGGQPVKGPHHSRGFVFQADAVFPWLTVRQNVEFGLKSRRVPRAQRARTAHEWCQTVGLGEFIDAFPKELSGGMRKRVDLARVYANDPEVLLMDEPFGALDAQTKERMQTDLLRMWEASRKTIVFVTHDVDEAVFLADEVVVMSSRPGEIAERVPIDISRPRTDETRISTEFDDARRKLRQIMQRLERQNAS